MPVGSDSQSDSDDGMNGYEFDDEDSFDREQGSSGNESDGADSDNDSLDDSEMNAVPKSSQKARNKPNAGAAHSSSKSTEIQNLLLEAQLYKSNLFKLELSELLSAITPPLPSSTSAYPSLTSTLFKVREILSTSAAQSAAPVADALSKLSDIKLPWCLDDLARKELQYTFAYEKPSRIDVVGSFMLGTGIKSKSGVQVDLAVEMPQTLFQPKDHLNNRYFHKRSFYLAKIASLLQSHSSYLDVTLSYSLLSDDVRKPILMINSSNSSKSKSRTSSQFTIRIIPTISASTFNLSKLSPSRNNVRPSSQPSASESTITLYPATPHYNAALLHDTTPVSHLRYIHSVISSYSSPSASMESNALKLAIQLGKYWLRNRSLERLSFIWSMVVASLATADKNKKENMDIRKIGKGWSEYQIFKVALEVLATWNWDAKKVFWLGLKSNGEDGDEFSEASFSKAYDVNIIAPTGKINIASDISISLIEMFQHEASKTLRLLNDSKSENDCFDKVFLKKYENGVGLMERFDHLIRIPTSISPPAFYNDVVQLDFPSLKSYLIHALPRLLKKGLTDRMKLIVALPFAVNSSSSLWEINSIPPQMSQESTQHANKEWIYVGIILNPDECTRLVDLGPDAEDEQAGKEFRRLWGNKAELRRFKDGSIKESVVWAPSSASPSTEVSNESKLLIVQQMVEYLLKRHLQFSTSEITYFAGQFNSILAPPSSFAAISTVPIPQTFSSLTQTYATLVSHLKAFSLSPDLPLSISNIFISHSALRHSSVVIPAPHPLPASSASSSPSFYSDSSFTVPFGMSYIEPISVVIEFEISGYWPDHLIAIQKMKEAFLLRFATLFENEVQGCKTQLGKTKENNQFLGSCFLDVSIPVSWVSQNSSSNLNLEELGYTFRLQLKVPREQYLLKSSLSPSKSQPPLPAKLQSLYSSALAHYSHTFTFLPRFSIEIHNLVLRYPGLSGVIRLFKKWIGEHWLGMEVSEEWCEIAVVWGLGLWEGTSGQESGKEETEVKKSGVSSVMNGFVRVLKWISGYDFKNSMLRVDLSSSSSSSTIVASNAENKSPGTFFVTEVTSQVEENGEEPEDVKNWEIKINDVSLKRMIVVARACLKKIEDMIVSDNGVSEKDVKSIFKTPTNHYHILIHLNPSVISTSLYSLFAPALNGLNVSEVKKSKYKNLRNSKSEKEREEELKEVTEKGKGMVGLDLGKRVVTELMVCLCCLSATFYRLHSLTVSVFNHKFA
ncbi:Nrap protein [Paraphysoderma sedebokerense]|nr:Nrap protein [Paraphysoderma sedebokerense]